MSSSRDKLLAKHAAELASFDKCARIAASVPVVPKMVCNDDNETPWVCYEAATMAEAVAIAEKFGEFQDIKCVRDGTMSVVPTISECSGTVKRVVENCVRLESSAIHSSSSSLTLVFIWRMLRISIDIGGHRGGQFKPLLACEYNRRGEVTRANATHRVPGEYVHRITWATGGSDSIRSTFFYNGLDAIKAAIAA